MEDVARRHPRVLADPRAEGLPGCALPTAASTLNWASGSAIRRTGSSATRSEINLAIWRGFQEAGIEIPYPQREIRILPKADGAPG